MDRKNKIIIIIAAVLFLFCSIIAAILIANKKPASEQPQETPIENTINFVNRYQLDYSIGAIATDQVFEALKTIVLKNQTIDRSEPVTSLELDEVSIRNHSGDSYYAYTFNLVVKDHTYQVLAQTDTEYGQTYVLTAAKTISPADNNSYVVIKADNIDQDLKNILINQAKNILSVKNPTTL